MKLWIDDVRPAPEGYVWAKSVDGAKMVIRNPGLYALKNENKTIELIDINSKFAISIFSWLKETNRVIPYRIHQD